MKKPALTIVLALLLAVTAACRSAHQRAVAEAIARVGGDPERGALLIQRYGCGGCHRIPGATESGGKRAPSLEFIAVEPYISGNLPNTTENLMRWIQSPHSIRPQSRMPELGVSPAEARDITTYLYSLR